MAHPAELFLPPYSLVFYMSVSLDISSDEMRRLFGTKVKRTALTSKGRVMLSNLRATFPESAENLIRKNKGNVRRALCEGKLRSISPGNADRLLSKWKGDSVKALAEATIRSKYPTRADELLRKNKNPIKVWERYG